ncbi:MAG TPA: TylF/MycF/NovP-related O-methyltransferase [Candidatus Dormibacteraeota bacterium]|nr:TylF/MycF/NovP-related O-methyltransferase [Candidatus Dormibacteraeota bacterium]
MARSRVERLPKPLRPAARRLRDVVRRSYPFEADGMGTYHLSPFLGDKDFNDAYARVRWSWDVADIRWRLWILTRAAIQCSRLDGSFAEFGVYRGGCAYMILTRTQPAPGRRYFLFDTFAGIPDDEHLTPAEREEGFGGRLGDVALDDVRKRLEPWAGRLEFVVGDVFKTMPQTETGPLAFVHMDLNAAAPTEAALRYAWPRIVPSGMIVFDDYGDSHYTDQRRLVDRYFASEGVTVFALPTAQALVIKQAGDSGRSSSAQGKPADGELQVGPDQ